MKGKEKLSHIHGTRRKTGVDLDAPEDLTQASESPNFYKMCRDQCTLIELKFKYQLKNPLWENKVQIFTAAPNSSSTGSDTRMQ